MAVIYEAVYAGDHYGDRQVFGSDALIVSTDTVGGGGTGNVIAVTQSIAIAQLIVAALNGE